MSRHDCFLLACRLKPAVVDEIRGSSVDSLQIGVKITLADFTVIIFGLVIDTAGGIGILIDIYFFKQVILEIFHLVFLVQLPLLHCLLHLADYHIAPSQQDHKKEGYLQAVNILAHTLAVQHDLGNVLYFRYLFDQLRNDHIDALCLR